MSNNKSVVYKLKVAWSSFRAGDKFTASGYDDLYKLVNDDGKLVLAEIPADLLDNISGDYWKLKEDEKYYYIDEDGDVFSGIFSRFSRGPVKLGNYFRTEEEAQAMATWLKARQRLIESGARFVNTIDVDSSQSYYTIYYTINRGDLVIEDAYIGENTVGDKRLYFDDRQLADKSIKEHREDWLTYLGVKEKSDDNS
jgi:hypothetical protein